jgi:Zn-dependent metalloprotease
VAASSLIGISPATAAPTADGAAVTRDENGRVRSVRPAADRTIKVQPFNGRIPSTPEDTARSHLSRYAGLFGVRDAARDLAPTGTDSQGNTKVVAFQQTVDGLPVIGGELNVALDAAGNLLSINGETSAASFSAQAKTSAATATATATAATAKATGALAKNLRASKPVLSAYDPTLLGAPDKRGSRAVWRIEVRDATNNEVHQFVLVNADDGRIALNFSQTAHADGARRICNFGNSPASSNVCPGAAAVTRTEGQAATGINDVDAAYELSGGFRDYLTTFGRNSIDNAGMDLVSGVNFCWAGGACPYANAFWDGTQMTYGAGYAAADDVVGHEFTHGVTQYTSKLLYYYQAGSINESMSDVLGEAFDQSYTGAFSGNDTPGAKWLLGEDLPGGAIRNMSNPPAYGQPDSTTSALWNAHPLDAGGVHINSGVGNKAAALMTDGGTFGGFTVVPIGDVNKVARIWLTAEGLLTAGSDYTDLAFALHQACINLTKTPAFGVTDQNCLSVLYSTGAVSMSNTPLNEGAIPQATQCAPGSAATNMLFDNLNWPASNSLYSAWTESGNASIDGSVRPSNSAGNALYIPDPYPDPVAAEHYAARSAFTQLPASGSVYAYFNHLYSFDFWPDGGASEYYDGGRVDIDVDGDANGWMPLTSGWDVGPNKQLMGRSGTWFSGDSRGWTSSRVALSGYLGKKVRLRFVVQSDGYLPATAAYGWWIDNLRIYNCSGKRPLTNDINGDGYGDVVIGEPGRKISNQAGGGDIRVVWGNTTGLDITGNEIFSQDNAYVAGAANTNGNFGAAVATADYHGDGFADIAVGSPNSPANEGSVTLLRGYAWGVTTQNSFFAAPASTTVPAPFAGSRLGASLAPGDFNNDGFADLAIGAPGHNGNQGGVKVLYGSANGLVRTAGATNWFVQGAGNVPDTAEADDNFGAALAAGDFNGDGRTDLAVGAPGENGAAGAVTILLGSATGITGAGSVQLDQESADVPETGEAGDQFGFALGAGDVTGDGKADLAVGAPGEDVGALADAGAVFLLLGASSGVVAAGSQVFDQDSPTVPDTAEAGDRFGTTVAVGDLNADGMADVAVGAPDEDVDTAVDAGLIITLPGSAGGLTTVGAIWHQGATGIVDTAEAGDRFGAALIAVKIRNSTKADLIVGAPYEDTVNFVDQGTVHFLTNTTSGNQQFSSGNLIGGGMTSALFGGALS